MTSYHVSVLYNTSIEIGCSKNGGSINTDFRGAHYTLKYT